jgi:Peptidase propeptide and YPEB domain
LDLRLAVAAAAAVLALWPASAFAEAEKPPISEERATEIAERDPNAIEGKRKYPDLFPSPTRADDGDWEVGFFADDEQRVLVVVDDETGEVEESWTGYQVAWRMARGYDGAFGRKLNAPYVWLPLCAIFLIGLFDWRRPLRLAHLDLLVLVAGFGVSHFFFNRGEIGLSVPLAYPALLYLLARTLWLAFRRGASGLRPSLPVTWLAIVTVGLIGFRVGLNVADSNVIDVGYSGVIGADLITDGEPLYDNFPDDNRHGDTYGPTAYYVYTPFEQLLPWGGDWDDLPAAHAAAIFFDLGTIAVLFLLGMRLRPGDGMRLATLLAFAWAACPYTAFALESNTNDSLVALLLVCALYFLASPAVRGGLIAAASLTKFAPLALAPLFATYRGAGSDADGEAVAWPPRRALRVIGPYALAFAAVALILMAQTLLDPGLSTFWDRTIGNQAGRDSPFSVWGQEPSLEWLHTALKVLAAGLALLVAVVPRRRDLVTVAALGAAVLIAAQLTVEHWFYLYIPWFAAFLFVALLARPEDQPQPSPAR